MLPFSIELKRGKPTHEQILGAVREALESGQLRDGDPFPSARVLTQELRISPRAAQLAVSALREDGFLARQGDSGLIVRAANPASGFTHAGAIVDDMATMVDAQPGSETHYPFLTASGSEANLGLLDGYEMRRLIAKGGMGLVFEAFDRGLERSVAIKVLAPEIAVSTDARTRFMREARAAAGIDHENVLHVHAVGETRGFPYLVMPLVEGESLQARLAREGALPIAELLRIGTRIARGLAAAHESGVIHRDIKPDNVLLESGGGERVWVVDFGLARAAEGGDLTRTGTLAGTPRFTSPEQGSGGEVDHRSDLFSLGSTLYAMAAGTPPFSGDRLVALLRSIAEDEPTPLSATRAEIPPELESLIASLLEKNPADRPSSAQEIAERLAAIQPG